MGALVWRRIPSSYGKSGVKRANLNSRTNTFRYVSLESDDCLVPLLEFGGSLTRESGEVFHTQMVSFTTMNACTCRDLTIQAAALQLRGYSLEQVL